jgi:nitroreductase
MDTIDAITRRVSTRAFQDAAVAREVLARLLDAAVRAPNHKLTEPWRFAVLTGASRDRYADIRRALRAAKFTDATTPDAAKAIERTWRETKGTPAIVVVMCAVADDAVRREEDYGAAMMATQNLLTAATAEGLGTYVRTGGVMEAPEVRVLARCPADHRIVAIVSVGYPAMAEPPRRRTPAAEKTVWLE